MQMMQPSSPGANGMTYANAPTYDGLTVPRWYASMMSSLYNQTGPWTRSAPQNACRIRGKALPNYSNSGTASLLVVLLTLGVSESGCTDRLGIWIGQQCA